MRSSRPTTVPSRRGFTLVEMLVAVAAVTLIILGVTRIFAATGETLRAGRRVSYMNAYAGLIEQQLREDISSMSRDGFLLIRHEIINAPLTDGAAAQNRRADELVFFARGMFRSKREQVVGASAIAEAPEARIYYGTGERLSPNDTRVTSPDKVRLEAIPPMDELGTGYNEFASDWILLRHVTLLAGVTGMQRDPVLLPGGSPAFGADAEDDCDVQYALQPSAAHIFRNLAFAPVSPRHDIARIPGNARPTFFESGAIDIATTDLAEIRAIVLDAQNPPSPSSAANPFDLSADEPGVAFTPANTVAGSDAEFMQAWMVQALPADSDATFGPKRQRMRCDYSPPNLFGLIGGGRRGSPVAWDQTRSDQLMLTASNFVPHCTEFKVEWSFGQAQQPGSGPSSNIGSVVWYCGGEDDLRDLAYPHARQADGSIDDQDYLDERVPRRSGKRPDPGQRISEDLIHGTGSLGPSRDRLYSFFGYVDPTYMPQADIRPGPPATAPTYEPDQGDVTSEPLSMPWPWPKLLRITIKLVDPSDPTNEQRYQYVFELPNAQSDL